MSGGAWRFAVIGADLTADQPRLTPDASAILLKALKLYSGVDDQHR